MSQLASSKQPLSDSTCAKTVAPGCILISKTEGPKVNIREYRDILSPAMRLKHRRLPRKLDNLDDGDDLCCSLDQDKDNMQRSRNFYERPNVTWILYAVYGVVLTKRSIAILYLEVSARGW
eukprot:g101.t1